jgi:hypothetical protein
MRLPIAGQHSRLFLASTHCMRLNAIIAIRGQQVDNAAGTQCLYFACTTPDSRNPVPAKARAGMTNQGCSSVTHLRRGL